MSEPTRVAVEVEERLRHFAGKAKELFSGLAELLEALPASPEEVSAEDLGEEPGAPTEARSLVLCVLNDLVRPAVASLLVAAGATPEEAAAQVPALPGVALSPGPLAREHEVRVARADWLPIPPAVAQRLDLVHGDFLMLERGPASVRLEPMRDLLRDFMAWPLEEQQRLISNIKERTSMYLAESVLVRPEILPLEPGDKVVLQVEDRGPGRHLYFFREEPPGQRPEPGEERR
jgi:hypothetical protein